MEHDVDRIPKNPDTDIIIRVDDFGGKIGLTIREFVKGERYTGFTKAGTRIPAEYFKKFKDAINSIDEKLFKETPTSQPPSQSHLPPSDSSHNQKTSSGQKEKGKTATKQQSLEDEEDSDSAM